jgi:hypothetical protein
MNILYNNSYLQQKMNNIKKIKKLLKLKLYKMIKEYQQLIHNYKMKVY